MAPRGKLLSMRWAIILILACLSCWLDGPLAATSAVVDKLSHVAGSKLVYTCSGARQVKVEANVQSDAEVACEGAVRALAFLAQTELDVSSNVTIEVVSQLSGELAGRAVGCYLRDTKRILVLSFDSFQTGGGWFRMPPSVELHRAVASHETAHSVVGCNSEKKPLSVAAHEYVAYVVLFATMDPATRTQLLDRFPGAGFGSAAEISDIAHIVNPNQFGVDAWRHFLKVKDREAWIKRVVSGEVVLEIADDPGAEDR